MGQTWNKLLSYMTTSVEDEQPQRRKEEEEQGPKGGEEEEQAPRKGEGKEQAPRKKKKNQEPALLEIPWRKIKGWSNEVRDDLKKDVACRVPETYGQLDVPYYNIALTGQIGAGKSSYFNSINNIFQEEVTGSRADVGRKASSLTKEYRVYEIIPKSETEPLQLRICDTMGLQPYKKHDCSNILKAVGGHIRDKYKFSDQDTEINENTPGYKASPDLKDKAHCVAIVVNAQGLKRMEEDVKQKLKELRQALGAPRTYILLTHIDEACEEVSRDVTKVYHSTAIQDLVRKVGKMLDGLPENQIFPVMNYKEQVELETAMDILLLYPLRQMLSNAQNYLKEETKKVTRHGTPVAVSHRGLPVAQPSPE